MMHNLPISPGGANINYVLENRINSMEDFSDNHRLKKR